MYRFFGYPQHFSLICTLFCFTHTLHYEYLPTTFILIVYSKLVGNYSTKIAEFMHLFYIKNISILLYSFFKTMGENCQTIFVNYLVSRTAMGTQPSVIFALKCAFFFFFFFPICFIFYQSLMIYRMNDKNQRAEVLVLYKEKLYNV